MLWAGVWCHGKASGNEFGRSELASAAGVSGCSQVGPEGPWQTRFEGQFWLEGTSKDCLFLQQDKCSNQIYGNLGSVAFQAEGLGSQNEHPQMGSAGGPGSFVVCILPLLVPCNCHPGNDGGVAEPLVPVRCCSITAWLETHTHADTSPLHPVPQPQPGPGGCSPWEPGLGRNGGGGTGQGACRGGTTGRRDNRMLPSPDVARPCILSPQGQIQAGLSHQVFLWDTPSSFPDFLYGKTVPASKLAHWLLLCVHTDPTSK